MARPKKNLPPDRFTSTEMAVAAGISPRNLNLLIDRGLAPDPARGSDKGKGATRVWDSFGVSQCGLIGAFHNQCGMELLLAAKLAHALAEEFGAAYGYIYSGLDLYLQAPLNPRPGWFPWDDRDGDVRPTDDFWLHHYLRSRSTIYRPRTQVRGDFGIEIVDRQYVFVNGNRDFNLKYVGGHDAAPSFRIVSLERNSDANVVSLLDEVNMDIGKPEGAARLKQIEDEFQNARRNAVSFLAVNMSLAVRNAFDAVHDYREESGADLNWQASSPRYPDAQPFGEDGWPIWPEPSSKNDREEDSS